MFSVVLTAAIVICANPNETISEVSTMETPETTGIALIADGVGANCVDQHFPARSYVASYSSPRGYVARGYAADSGMSCGCIRSSANYAWNWFRPVKKIFHLPQSRQYDLPPGGTSSCPAYYALYDRSYNYRRAYDYQWRSPTYRPRNVASLGAVSTRDCVGQAKPGYVNDGLVPTPEVLVLPEPQRK